MQERIQLAEALALIREKISPVEGKEYLPLYKATGMILAEDIFAAHDQPPFDRSPLDGYAVRSADLAGASPQTPAELTVIDRICAGMCSAKRVEPGQAVRIMTGAPVPAGADCVVAQEQTERRGDLVRLYQQQGRHENVCFQGEDYRHGRLLLAKGEKLDAIKLGIISGNGQSNVTVYRPPRIAVITTGDEICRGGELLAPGKIYDSNCQMLSGRVMELQCEPYDARILRDDTDVVRDYIHRIIDHVDGVITAGALSVGEKDIMHDVLDNLPAEGVFRRVQIKPGAPVTLSLLRGKPILSLSGNPFAALATFEVLARPLLAVLRRDESLLMTCRQAVMASAFRKKSRERRFLRASLEDGRVYLRGGNSPGILSSMAGCNCLLDIPAGSQGLEPGEPVTVWML